MTANSANAPAPRPSSQRPGVAGPVAAAGVARPAGARLSVGRSGVKVAAGVGAGDGVGVAVGTEVDDGAAVAVAVADGATVVVGEGVAVAVAEAVLVGAGISAMRPPGAPASTSSRGAPPMLQSGPALHTAGGRSMR